MNDNESIDKMLKRFKKKYERAGVLKEFRKTHTLSSLQWMVV